MKYQRLSGSNIKNLFSHHSGVWKSKIEVPANSFSGESSLSSWLTASYLLTVSSHGLPLVRAHGEKARMNELSGVFFLQGPYSRDIC